MPAGALPVFDYGAESPSEMTPNVTPCGSASTAKRPTSGMSLEAR